MPKVTVISPIYKVEKFIERAAESMLSQTLDDIEYIFVDDCTPDKSIEILESVIARHPERKDSIKIIYHNVNKGLPAARNTGLDQATGDYVFHWDSDDYAELTMLEEMYDHAIDNDLDIVWCDWFLTFEKNERYMRQPSYTDPIDALKAMLSGTMKYNVWNKLSRRSLFTENGVLFPEGHNMGEDMTMMLLFAHAKKVAYIPGAFYHYVKLNTNAYSKTYSEKHLEELKHNVKIIEQDLKNLFGLTLMQEIAFLKLEAKFPFLLSGDSKKYSLWKTWYPEANKYIMKNKNISVRSRIIQWCAWKNLDFVVYLYRFLIERILYGMIYK